MVMDVSRLRICITERDISILVMVYQYGGCAVSHLFRRFWGVSERTLDTGNSCYRRIHQLVEAGYLHADRLPSLTGLGAGHLFLTLGPKGRAVLAEHLRLSRSDLKRLRQIITPFIGAHHLAICDFRCSLEIACARSGFAELVEWTSERELRAPPILKITDPRPPTSTATAPLIPLISDGEFRLRLSDGAEVSARLEMDMGTIASKRIRARFRAYLAHAPVDERPVLWVVPDISRQQALTQWAAQEARLLSADTDPTIFWSTPREHIHDTTILDTIWQVVGGPRIALLPSPAPTAIHFNPPQSTSRGAS